MSVDDILAEAAAYADQLIPPTGELSMEPGRTAHETLVQVPTLFWATGGTQQVQKLFYAGGGAAIAVTVTATPKSWDWTVDGQNVLTTDFPGRPYDGVDPTQAPGHYASYEFVHTGVHTATVQCSWTATTDIRGLGPQDIAGVVAKNSPPLNLTALQARAQLEYR